MWHPSLFIIIFQYRVSKLGTLAWWTEKILKYKNERAQLFQDGGDGKDGKDGKDGATLFELDSRASDEDGLRKFEEKFFPRTTDYIFTRAAYQDNIVKIKNNCWRHDGQCKVDRVEKAWFSDNNGHRLNSKTDGTNGLPKGKTQGFFLCIWNLTQIQIFV